MSTPKLFATRDFTDAGTGRAFTSGAELTNENTENQLENYKHAGLAAPKAETPAAAASADKAPTKAA